MNIIKKNYFEFLDKKCENCLNKTYKNLFNLKMIEYPSTNSNSQIKYFLEDVYKNNNIIYLNQFITFLTHFITFEDTFKLLELIVQKKLMDIDIIKLVEKYRINKVNTTYTIGEKCNKLLFGTEYLKHRINDLVNPSMKYLDIGCGDGRKTNTFSKVFGFKNVYGTDIQRWGPYQNKKNFQFNFKYIKNDKLDFQDNTFDVISCILTLHHIEKMDNMIEEIYRILKPNGILILIEHNASNYLDKLLIDIQHTFFAYLYDGNENYIKNPDYACFLNHYELEYIFTELHKFKFLEMDNLYENVDMQKRYDNQIFQIYQK